MSLGVLGSRHAQALLGSLGRLARAPLGTTLTLLVIALALAVPTALALFVLNVQLATGGLSRTVEVSVYLKSDVPLAKAEQLTRSARARAGVAEVVLVPADRALEEFRNYSGFGAALAALKDNPLPHMLRIRPAPGTGPAELESLRAYLAAWPEVDQVQADSDWVRRLAAILELLRRVLLFSAVLLGAGVVAVIGNTIRLEIQNRRAEIEVTKLVGGSNAFVRRPFLYTGLIYGAAGGIMAWLIVALGVLLLAAPVQTLASLYGSRYALAGPDLPQLGILLGTGALLGMLGAWMSCARHLRSIEPRA